MRPLGAAVRRPEYVGDPARRAWERVSPLARRAVASPWFWLAAGSLVVFVAGLAYIRDIKSFFVMSDEMTYFKEALHIFEQRRPVGSTDRYYSSLSQLAGLLRAPAFGAGNVPTAWDIMRVTNLVLWTSAVVPAFLIARDLVRWRPLAVGTALACVCVPWIAIAGSVLTDAVAYAAFVWALAAMHHGLTRPGPRADAVALVAIGVAAAVRPQHAVLLGAYVPAIVLHAAGWAFARRDEVSVRQALRRAGRDHVLVLVVLAGLALVAVAIGVGTLRDRVLGNYSVAGAGTLFPPGSLAVARELAGTVALAAGGLPIALAAAYVLATLWRPDTRERHAFAVLSICAGAATLAVATSFIIRFSAGAGLSERYACYLAPLMLLGTAAALSRRRLPVAALVAGAAFTWWTFSAIPTLAESVNLFAPAAPFHKFVNAHLLGLAADLPLRTWTPATIIAAAIVVATLAMALPRRVISPPVFAGAVGAAILAFVGFQTAYALKAIVDPQKNASAQYLADRDWVDETVGWNHRVAAVVGELYGPVSSPEAWWEATFWNRSVDYGYVVAPSGESLGQERSSPVSVDPRTGAVEGFQGEHYVLTSLRDQRFALIGARPLRTLGELQVARMPAHPHVSWLLQGTDSAGRLSRTAPATLKRFAPSAPRSFWALQDGSPRGGSLTVSMAGWRRTVTIPRTGASIHVSLPSRSGVIRFRARTATPKTKVRITLSGPPLLAG